MSRCSSCHSRVAICMPRCARDLVGLGVRNTSVHPSDSIEFWHRIVLGAALDICCVSIARFLLSSLLATICNTADAAVDTADEDDTSALCCSSSSSSSSFCSLLLLLLLGIGVHGALSDWQSQSAFVLSVAGFERGRAVCCCC